MLTPEGAALLLSIAAGQSDDSLTGGRLVIRGGSDSASAPFDGVPRVEAGDSGALLVVEATFGEDAANFEWATREVVSAGGVVVDRHDEDQGRKVQGQVWTLEAQLELGPA